METFRPTQGPVKWWVMNKNTILVAALALLAGAQMQIMAMDADIREVFCPIGQADMGCKFGCTAFAFTGACMALARDVRTIGSADLQRIANAANAMYRMHPDNGTQIEVDEALIQIHNNRYAGHPVREDWQALERLHDQMDFLAPSTYLMIDALCDIMRQNEHCAAVITMVPSEHFGVSFALVHDHGTWFFYDSHTDHKKDGGSYACTFQGRIPNSVRVFMPLLNTADKKAFEVVRITFLTHAEAAASTAPAPVAPMAIAPQAQPVEARPIAQPAKEVAEPARTERDRARELMLLAAYKRRAHNGTAN